MVDTTSSINERNAARVLIVEDEVDVAELYEMWLLDQYDVQVAHNGNEALAQLDESVDVVLLDRRMPGISGDEVLEKIRSRNLNCRVAIVSAVTPDFDVIEMGFDDYLTKPVDRQEVIEAIERMLTRSQYDSNSQEFYQLVATQAALRESKTRPELEHNHEYQQLTEKIEQKRLEMDDMVAGFEDDDFEAAFRKFDDTG